MAKATKQEAPAVTEESDNDKDSSSPDTSSVQLQEENARLKLLVSSLQKDLKVARDTIESTTRDTMAVEDEKAKNPDNYVVLDNKRYSIVWRSTVHDLVFEGHFKRHVEEENTAVVIEKHGG